MQYDNKYKLYSKEDFHNSDEYRSYLNVYIKIYDSKFKFNIDFVILRYLTNFSNVNNKYLVQTLFRLEF